jgi:hypothetical protein
MTCTLHVDRRTLRETGTGAIHTAVTQANNEFLQSGRPRLLHSATLPETCRIASGEGDGRPIAENDDGDAAIHSVSHPIPVAVAARHRVRSDNPQDLSPNA